jgi:hypothetical protein
VRSESDFLPAGGDRYVRLDESSVNSGGRSRGQLWDSGVIESDPDVEALVRQATPRLARGLAGRERTAEALVAICFVATAGALAWFSPDSRPAPVHWVVVFVTAYALAHRVRFRVGAGTTSPTQLVFIPMLLLLPAAIAPLLVATALVLSRLPEYLTGRVHPERALLSFGDAWFAVGPAALLAFASPGEPSFSHWPLYAGALGIQFAIDASFSMLRERLASGVSPVLQLKILALVFGIDLALTPLGLLMAGAAPPEPFTILVAVPLLVLLAMMGHERERRIEQALALSDAYRGTALLMGEMLGADDPYTGGEHSEGVVALACSVGHEMAIDSRMQRKLEFASLLHDLGKLRTPKGIINKPGALTPEEWDVVRRHPGDGHAMLARIGGLLAEVGLVVRAHHERWDGSGYPDGLAEERIPLEARIISACDAYSAMTTTRSYRDALPSEHALAELRKGVGSQFDPDVVEAIVKVLAREVRP